MHVRRRLRRRRRDGRRDLRGPADDPRPVGDADGRRRPGDGRPEAAGRRRHRRRERRRRGGDSGGAGIVDSGPPVNCNPINMGGSADGGASSCADLLLTAHQFVVGSTTTTTTLDGAVVEVEASTTPVTDLEGGEEGGVTLSGGGISEIPLQYKAGEIDSITATSLTLTGLTNGTTYHVAVTSIDGSGNVGPPSTLACGKPGAVNDFWQSYKDDGGGASGCALERSAQLAGRHGLRARHARGGGGVRQAEAALRFVPSPSVAHRDRARLGSARSRAPPPPRRRTAWRSSAPSTTSTSRRRTSPSRCASRRSSTPTSTTIPRLHGCKPFHDVFGTGSSLLFSGEFDWQALRIPHLGTLGPGIGAGLVSFSAAAPTRGQPSNGVRCRDVDVGREHLAQHLSDVRGRRAAGRCPLEGDGRPVRSLREARPRPGLLAGDQHAGRLEGPHGRRGPGVHVRLAARPRRRPST